jgi:hypothetical protein
MPQLGEIKHGKEIGYKDRNRLYVWTICPICKRERWVHMSKGIAKFKYCIKCSQKAFLGENNPSWKGGKSLQKSGYVWAYVTKDDFYFPMAGNKWGSSGYVLEHRLVMAKSLNRLLTKDELVHHKNGIKDDNRLDNLEILSKKNHIQDHSKGYQDGFDKGYTDGNNKRIQELEKEIKQLKDIIDG